MKPNFPRIFAYLTAAFSIGMAVFIFTNLLYPFVQRPDWIGSLSLIGFALIYVSVTIGLGRRFIRKTNTHFMLPYLMIPLMVIPAIVASWLQHDFALMQDALLFYVTITIGSSAGAFRGIQSGRIQREKLIEQIQRMREESTLK
jgi:ABC-type Fe3+-siderophore transport system permease subunit